MKKILNESGRNEKGQALVIVLGLLAIGGLTIAPLLNYMSTGLKAGQLYEKQMVEFYSADAGVELALWNLKNFELEVPEGGQSALEQFTMNAKTVDVTVDNIDGQTYRITSIATSNDGSGTTIEAYVMATAGFFDREFDKFEGNFQLGVGESYVGNVWSQGNVQLEVSGNLTGYVYAQGNVQLYSGAQITGNVMSEGDVQLQPGAIVIGNVCAEGNIQLDVGAQIIGNVYAQGNVQLYDGAIIDGDVHTADSVQLDGSATITGSIYYSYPGCPLSEGSSEVLSWIINP